LGYPNESEGQQGQDRKKQVIIFFAKIKKCQHKSFLFLAKVALAKDLLLPHKKGLVSSRKKMKHKE
jgi:hypothetical protein